MGAVKQGEGAISCQFVISGQWSVVSGQLGIRRRNELCCGCGECFEGWAARDFCFAALGLGFAEADDGPVELAFDASHVTHQRFETFGLGVADEELEGAGFENGGFVAAGSLQTPEAGGDFGDDLRFERAYGSVVAKELVVEAVEIGLVFAAEDDGFSGQSVPETIHARNGLAGFGAGACGQIGLHFLPVNENAAHEERREARPPDFMLGPRSKNGPVRRAASG